MPKRSKEADATSSKFIQEGWLELEQILRRIKTPGIHASIRHERSRKDGLSETAERVIATMHLLEAREDAAQHQDVFSLYNKVLKEEQEFAFAYQYLIKGLARKYQRSRDEYDDLWQCGYIGLMIAVRKFDYSKEVQFSTHAKWWIRAEITRYLDNFGRIIRQPSCFLEQQRNLREILDTLEQNDQVPSDAHLMDVLGVAQTRLDKLRIGVQTVSIHGKSNSSAVGESEPGVEDRYVGTDGEEIVMTAEWLSVHWAWVSTAIERELTERERYILCHCFGLEGHPTMTLTELGDAIGLSRERVRQIRNNAIKKLASLAV